MLEPSNVIAGIDRSPTGNGNILVDLPLSATDWRLSTGAILTTTSDPHIAVVSNAMSVEYDGGAADVGLIQISLPGDFDETPVPTSGGTYNGDQLFLRLLVQNVNASTASVLDITPTVHRAAGTTAPTISENRGCDHRQHDRVVRVRLLGQWPDGWRLDHVNISPDTAAAVLRVHGGVVRYSSSVALYDEDAR